MVAWRNTRAADAALVRRLPEGGDYVGVWERLATCSRGWDGQTLLCLADQVLRTFRTNLGVRDSDQDVNSAFLALWRRSNRSVDRNEQARDWLMEQVCLAMQSSIGLAADLYYYWASSRNGIIRMEDREQIRRAICEAARNRLTSSEELIRISHPVIRFDLYHLVFPADGEDGNSINVGPEYWQWLGPMLLDALRRAPRCFAPKIAGLISINREIRNPWTQVAVIVPGTLATFFKESATEVIQLIAAERDRLTGRDREYLDQIVRSTTAVPDESIVEPTS